MRRQFLVPAAMIAAVLMLAACAPAAPAPAPTSSATMTSAPSPEPTAQAQLELTVDGLHLLVGDEEKSAGFDDAAAVLALLEQATGTLPEPTPVDDLPGYDMNLVNYTWAGLTLVADETGTGFARIIVSDSSIDGVPIATPEGVTVGSTRDELVSAGAADVWNQGDVATAGELGLGMREVADTNSLANPGTPGVEFLMFTLDGDTVSAIHAPADDFSDL
ncbi:hypothetical protein [Microbacterium sp. NPDC089695]|uniref:hypothetical protein n=1 Tax=Microbacterium sp. NPDC089695 TaxID=3364198 RepID=UPI0037F4BFD8